MVGALSAALAEGSESWEARADPAAEAGGLAPSPGVRPECGAARGNHELKSRQSSGRVLSARRVLSGLHGAVSVSAFRNAADASREVLKGQNHSALIFPWFEETPDCCHVLHRFLYSLRHPEKQKVRKKRRTEKQKMMLN